jgi:ketosteroid isomerase-like protein
MKRLPVLLLALFCATGAAASSGEDISRIAGTLKDWHAAAAGADESRYFGHLAPEFVFLGTDANERWDLASFRSFAHPYFAKGKAWTFVPRDQHITLSPHGDVAWFDEKLDSSSYGQCRGSGVLRRIGDAWKLSQYNLTIPIPNEIAKEVVKMIAARPGAKQ